MLPNGHEKLKTEKPYFNLSKLTEGEYKIRIVGQPIAGWVDWKDKKPYRYKADAKPSKSFDAEKPMKAFWALHVWSYDKKGLFVMEVTQSGILKSLTALEEDEDWGDTTQYDLKIKKVGSGKDTEYSVTPLPAKELPKEAKDALRERPVRLEALYEGKDPWGDATYIEADEETGEIEIPASLERLEDLLIENKVNTHYLKNFIDEVSAKGGSQAQDVIRSALMPGMFDKFKEAYTNRLSKIG